MSKLAVTTTLQEEYKAIKIPTNELELKEYQAKVAARTIIPVKRMIGDEIVTMMFDRESKKYIEEKIIKIENVASETHKVQLVEDKAAQAKIAELEKLIKEQEKNQEKAIDKAVKLAVQALQQGGN